MKINFRLYSLALGIAFMVVMPIFILINVVIYPLTEERINSLVETKSIVYYKKSHGVQAFLESTNYGYIARIYKISDVTNRHRLFREITFEQFDNDRAIVFGVPGRGNHLGVFFTECGIKFDVYDSRPWVETRIVIGFFAVFTPFANLVYIYINKYLKKGISRGAS